MIGSLLITCLLSTTPMEDSQAELHYASDALLAGLIGSAESSFKEANRLDPENLDALLTLALLYVELGENEKAIPLFQKVLSLDPYNDDARVDLILALWNSEKLAEAKTISSDLSNRHPTWEKSVELASRLEQNLPAPQPPSPWKTIARIGLSGGYDTNIGLMSAVFENSDQKGSTLRTDLMAGITNTKRSNPFTVFAHASTDVLLGGQEAGITQYLPTTAGITGVARTYWDVWDSSLHLDYSEVLTEFTRREFSLLSPTVYMERALPGSQVLRILGAADYRVHASEEVDKDLTMEFSIRDTLHLSSGHISINVFGRPNLGITQTSEDSGSAVTIDLSSIQLGFWESGGTLYTEWAAFNDITFFGLADFRKREFLSFSSKEITFAGEIGVRWAFNDFSLYAQYGGLKNDNDHPEGIRDFTRHQVRAGVNYWIN